MLTVITVLTFPFYASCAAVSTSCHGNLLSALPAVALILPAPARASMPQGPHALMPYSSLQAVQLVDSKMGGTTLFPRNSEGGFYCASALTCLCLCPRLGLVQVST